ncbi:MAG: STAS/SEC14 domain-containing protein [Nitrospirales bacterium]
MYRVIDESSGSTVGIKVDGKLTKDDYGVLLPYLENLIHEYGALNLLCDMTQFNGMEVSAFWEDFKFSIQHLRDFKRIAIIGDQRWLDWYTVLFNPFVKTKMRYFPLAEISDAWKWVKSEMV